MFCKLVKSQGVNITRRNNALPNSHCDVGPGTVEFYTRAFTLRSYIFPYANRRNITDTFPGLQILHRFSEKSRFEQR